MWRSLDVRAVVEALPFSDASVAGGTAGLGRPVSRARMVGTSEQLREVGANELVVTTMATLVGTGDPKRFWPVIACACRSECSNRCHAWMTRDPVHHPRAAPWNPGRRRISPPSIRTA